VLHCSEQPARTCLAEDGFGKRDLQHFAALRPAIARRAREAAGAETFRRYVDRGRWSLRHALQCGAVGQPPSP
jgi:hypothetical protein